MKVNGKAMFGMDKKLPGLLYAVVERSPKFHGKVKSFDDSAAKAVPGVKQILKVQMNVFSHKREGVAVVATNVWAAMQGRKALKVEWDDTGFEHLDSEQLATRMRQDLDKPVSPDAFEAAFNNSSAVIEYIYEAPYQSHSCMEPLNCIADVKADSVEVWGPIQVLDWVQRDISCIWLAVEQLYEGYLRKPSWQLQLEHL